MNKNKLDIIAYEIVEGCNLKCNFCARNATHGSINQLNLDQVDYLLSLLKKFGVPPQVALTGGEPLLHNDIIEITKKIEKYNISYSITTNGTIINENLLEFLHHSKLFRHFIISVDSSDKQIHNKIRGVENSFDKTNKFIQFVKKYNINFCINMTVSNENLLDIYKTVEWAKKIGAKDISIATVKPSGRGKAVLNFDELLIFSQQIKKSQKLIDSIFSVWVPEITIFLYDFKNYEDSYLSGEKYSCGFGNGSLHVDFFGNVKGCATCDYPLGNVYTHGFDLLDFWNNSEILCKIRDKHNLTGYCRTCKYVDFCGGCRCRAFAINGNLFGDDPYCPIIQKGIDYEKYV